MEGWYCRFRIWPFDDLLAIVVLCGGQAEYMQMRDSERRLTRIIRH